MEDGKVAAGSLHAPSPGAGGWRVVSSDAYSVTVVAMCVCGGDDCWFVTSASVADAHHEAG